MKKVDVVGIGALNFDLLLKVDRILARESEVCIKEECYFPGGSAANTIYGLAKLGLKASFIGAVGNDWEGKKIIQDFESVDVDVSCIKILSARRTGLALGVVDEFGKRALYISPRANSFLNQHHANLDYIKIAKFLHLTSFANLEQLELQKQIVDKVAGKLKISFAPGALYTKLGLKYLLAIVKKSEIIFLNQEELKTLTHKNYIQGSEKLIGIGCKTVAVTLGEKGCYVASDKKRYHIKAVKTKIFDLTGAGDAFATGFLYGYLKNKSLEECGRLGNVVASLCISKFGAREGLPNEEELLTLLRHIVANKK
jgi:ribokinase